MKYQVRLKPSAEKELKKLPERDIQKVLAALLVLAENHRVGKKLEGKYKGYYSLRVWPYRIIYQIFQRELLIIVIRIGQRQGVYR